MLSKQNQSKCFKGIYSVGHIRANVLIDFSEMVGGLTKKLTMEQKPPEWGEMP